MGEGYYSSTVHAAAVTYRSANKIPDFDHSVRAAASGNIRTHDQLNPAKLGAMGVRESRDSDDHPSSLAIIVALDETGSLRTIPPLVQKNLPALYNLLLDKKYAVDPQILFAGVGDATYDRAPLQVGQFESDNRADEDLRKLMLEGLGGGSKHESYELLLYFAARKTAIDCIENRNHKGYLFIIGDEMAYNFVSRAEVKKLIGDELSEDIPTKVIVQEAQEMYDIFFIVPPGAAHSGDREVLDFWRDMLGQNVIELDDLDNLVKTIAVNIALGEKTITAEDARSILHG